MSQPRRYLVWAEVRRTQHVLVLPPETTDEDAEALCRKVLDGLISNGDTGWEEVPAGETRQQTQAVATSDGWWTRCRWCQASGHYSPACPTRF